MTTPIGACRIVIYLAGLAGSAPNDEVSSFTGDGGHEVAVGAGMKEPVAFWNGDCNFFFGSVCFLSMHGTSTALEDDFSAVVGTGQSDI